ncbi:hypothetical protein N7535_006323 [Penicillium sp. DV-2018c]|nr:hypothetical protein N7461_007598 [Penicillium sp. DV-2018c]KAJ5567017.1 hypothetical protein N7535_006323 [Penicillium sp. DV-2018c]
MSPTRVTLWARDTASDLKSVPSTFSSWDKCMAKSYCKWPVIVGIIVGNKPSKHLDDAFHQPPPPVQNPVYHPSPAPPSYRGAPQSTRAPSFRNAPQTARFEASKTPAAHVNEDALPDMPTWAGAVDKHVEVADHHDDVEMKPLDPPDRKQGAGTPGVAYSSNSAVTAGGYRGFGPTDPYARRSPGPGAAFNSAQDPYARRSPGVPSPGGAIDPYGRRSPGPAAALAASQDPYGRRSPGVAVPPAAVDPYRTRSPGPAVGYATSPQDPYGSRTPALASPVGAPVHNPYDQQHYHDSHDDESYGADGNGYHALTAPSPVGAYKPHTNYSPVPMPISPSSEVPSPGFQRQPSFGSSQLPPYTSQPSYRGMSPGPAPSPSEYTTYNPHANPTPAPEPDNTRPPSLLQSGKKPPVNASSNF